MYNLLHCTIIYLLIFNRHETNTNIHTHRNKNNWILCEKSIILYQTFLANSKLPADPGALSIKSTNILTVMYGWAGEFKPYIGMCGNHLMVWMEENVVEPSSCTDWTWVYITLLKTWKFTCSVRLQEERISVIPEIHAPIRQLVYGCHLPPQTTKKWNEQHSMMCCRSAGTGVEQDTAVLFPAISWGIPPSRIPNPPPQEKLPKYKKTLKTHQIYPPDMCFPPPRPWSLELTLKIQHRGLSCYSS